MPPFFQHSSFAGFRPPAGLRWIVLGWLGAEVVALALVVHAVGVGNTLLIGLLTTVLGVGLLRRAGLDALKAVSRGVEGTAAREGALPEGLLAALGAVLLILPGFVAKAAGLLLAAPSGRRAVLRRFGAGAIPASGARRATAVRPDVIDLSPDDWRIVDRR